MASCSVQAIATTSPLHLSHTVAQTAHHPSSASWDPAHLHRASSPIPFSGQCCRFSANKSPRGVSLHAINLTGIEQDLPENDEFDTSTLGEAFEDVFPYGIADGHHTFHAEDANIDVWEAFKEPFIEAGGPRGFQAFLGWGSLPAFYLMLYFGVKVEYIFLAAVLYIFAYIGIEMDKPDLDHEFPPEIYMERRKRRMQEQEVKE